MNSVDQLPVEIREIVRRILERQVAGGAERYKRTGDVSGRQGQREVSRIMKSVGISENDPRWQAVNRYGKELYHGRASLASGSARDSRIETGAVYTQGASFRARAEAHARAFRVSEIKVAHRKYGHILAEDAADEGRNFLHEAAFKALKARDAAGKGIALSRTGSNMLSSQALCFNMLAPLMAAGASGLRIAAEALAAFVPGLCSVTSITLEYTPPFDIFHDQSGLVGVDCDALIEVQTASGDPGILVLETKFVEDTFSTCGHREKGRCTRDVIVGADFRGCRYTSGNGFLYWQRAAESHTIQLPVVGSKGCPFGGPLWQIWVNHTLAHAEAKRRNAKRAVFATCAPEENEELAARANLDEYRALVTDPGSVIFIPLGQLLERIESACAKDDNWREWSKRLRRRYTVPLATTATPIKPRVTAGQRKTIEWMHTRGFQELVQRHEVALAGRASIYFRPTERGFVRIALHPAAPAYVGFGTGDNGCIFRPASPLPSIERIRSEYEAFEVWLKDVRRVSEEERGVIRWIRSALVRQLYLSELGDDWVFLHQECRFTNAAGIGIKSDVLAVHLTTGQLGIVELKADSSGLPRARQQIAEYGAIWQRDREQLAPLFTSLLRALGGAYNNERASAASVSQQDAALFVGVARSDSEMQIQACV